MASVQRFDSLEVITHPSRKELGEEAAKRVAVIINAAIKEKGEARVIFACAPSQNEFLAALVRQNIEWNRVVIFHMDEYVALSGEHSASFRSYLREHLLNLIPTPLATHLIKAESEPLAEAERYSQLLKRSPVDLVCLGIGENGHLAFNDPPVADFKDPLYVKLVELDLACRQQQVNDGCFASLKEVPTHALTLTIPALMASKAVSGCVPGPRKALAVRDTLLGVINRICPGSILRTHSHATLHIDTASASLLPQPSVIKEEKRLRAQVYDSGFADAHDTYNGMGTASDGKIYYVLSSAKHDVGAVMCSFDPASGSVKRVGDLTEACGEGGKKSISQGKSHVNFVEANGKLYFATHIGYYSIVQGAERTGVPPEGYTAYPGGHFLAYDLASGRFEELTLAPEGTLFLRPVDPDGPI